jgi:hypothetical protein
MDALIARHGADSPQTREAAAVLATAEELLSDEKADPRAVVPAALLHHLETEEVRGELLRLGFTMDSVVEICRIIEALQSGEKINHPNFAVVSDAIALASGTAGDEHLMTGYARALAAQADPETA